MSALSFTAKSPRSASRLCTSEGHDTARASAGRYRVALAGHPLLSDHGDVVYCCERCRERLTGLWVAAGGLDPAANPARGAQEAL